MAFVRVIIEYEGGGRVKEGVTVPYSIFPQVTDARFSCLRFVDPYGDTVFNRPQMPFVLADLGLLKSELQKDQITDCLEPIEAMAKECEKGVHLYLRFVGD